ncbi:protein-tyrosine phosphatase [Opitutaceae bacterium TAV5]|nr:protein-tyrosine phosphatase [Opitutaceae bacterium TAV5]
MKTRLLFVCSRNRWRSPAAEALFRNHPHYDARSAGTASSARIRITACHIKWADRIFCMERKHAQILRERFAGALARKEHPVIVLDIPDDYTAMDAGLLELLRETLAAYLEFPVS